jgi:hypothetical protein
MYVCHPQQWLGFDQSQQWLVAAAGSAPMSITRMATAVSTSFFGVMSP